MHRLSIEELLDLYLNHQLNPEQRQELSERINHDHDEEHAAAWFYRLWDETRQEKADKSSEEAFTRLKQRLALKDDSMRFSQFFPSSSRSGQARLKAFMRYAAVFLMAFGLAWVISHTNDSIFPSPVSSKVNVLSVPNGSKGFLTLEDGTEIWLNCGSRLTYNNFSGAPVREVFLEGEAFFNVRKGNTRPFIVKTSDLKLKVLGTRFNVKSYPSEKITETVLVTGKLQIEELNPVSAGKKFITLEPNQKATFFSATGKMVLDKKPQEAAADLKVPVRQQHIETVNPELYTSWKDEKLIFNNERLESLIVKMERWYNVNIILRDTLLKDYRYTGKFERENIEQALKALKLATPLEYEIDKNKIVLSLAGERK